MAYYYDIWVSTKQFRSSSTLTYSSEDKLIPGTIVSVPFRSKIVLGLIKSEVSVPKFTAKPVLSLIHIKSLPEATINLLKWLIEYYPSSASTHLQLFLPNSISKVKESLIIDSKEVTLKDSKINQPRLTAEQASTIKTIKQYPSRTFLIHGNTGSGKTRVYIELIKDTLSKLKSVIFLIPEIGLSPQIIQTLEDYFPNRVIAINSGLSEKIKRENWENILVSKIPIIVVGPRSALFMPVDNLGLIIIDEAHDDSYKQENAPFYQATRVAAKLSEITNSKLVMGTATPLISDYYTFGKKKIPIIRMVKPALSSNSEITPKIKVIDLADRSLFTRSSWLSDAMLESIE